MGFSLRFLIVTCAAAFMAMAVASIVSGLIWRFGAARLRRLAPGRRAAWIAAVRLLPSLAGLAAGVGLVVPAMLRFEPRHAEDVSLALQTAGVAGLIAVVITAARLAASINSTLRVWRVWRTAGRPLALAGVPVPVRVVDSAFPIVVLVGVWRPAILLAADVVRESPPGRLRAILEHERAHLARRDNLWRLLVQAPWDPLAWTAAGRELAAAWQAASEQAADDRAADRLALAESLVWVARRAAGTPAPLLHASALEGDREIADRVRRLLDEPAPAGPDRTRRPVPWAAAGALAAAVAFAVASDEIWRRAHALIEVAVASLP